MSTRAVLFALLLALGLAGTGVLVAQETYKPLDAVPSIVPAVGSAGSSGSESQVWTTALHPIPTRGDPTGNVTLYFTNSGATAQVEVGFYRGSEFIYSEGPFTFTASTSDTTVINAVTYYTTGRLGFDTTSMTHMDVRVTGAVSAGTARFRSWTHGFSGRAP